MSLHRSGVLLVFLLTDSYSHILLSRGSLVESSKSNGILASDRVQSLRRFLLGLSPAMALHGQHLRSGSSAHDNGKSRIVKARLAVGSSDALEDSPGVVYAPLSGQMVTRVSDGEQVDLGRELSSPGTKLCILGTYPADFNMIEYLQHLVYYLPKLKERGVSKFLCTINGSPASAKVLAELLGLPDEIQLFSDESGSAGRAFGVGRGWLPDENELQIGDRKLPISPYVKLLGMLLGLGARDTLPSVITGYIGNPWGKNGWIQAALAQGQRAGRWPDMALDLDDSGAIRTNSFDELPVVGSWGRRPLELATLRLQTMLGISLARWSDLQPTDDRCLTQLGGVVVVDGDGRSVYDWRDNGICNVADFEKIVDSLAMPAA